MVTTSQLLNLLKTESQEKVVADIQQLPGVVFSAYLDTLMQQKNCTPAQLINMTLINRTYAYQIFNGSKVPSRDKVLQIALALKLSEKETSHLLSLSNNGELYPKVSRDAAIIFALVHNYNVMQTNEFLADANMAILK